MLSRSAYEKKFPDNIVTYDDLVSLVKGDIKLYAHSMDYRKVRVLERIAKININQEWVKVQQDSALIKWEERDFTIQIDAVHASRLVWFGLIDSKEKRSGLYRINSSGILFLKGLEPVPGKIYVNNGTVYERSEYVVFIHEVKNVAYDKEFWDKYAANGSEFLNSRQTEMNF